MKKIHIVILSCLTLLQTWAAETPWLTNVPKALAEAKTSQKMVLIDFTGSDWCGWCIKFKKDVLSKPEFEEYAKKNLVLVELDFPRKAKQSDDLKKTNEELKKKYAVEGFPTFVILNGEGKEVGRQVGYSEGGPAAFIKKLEEFKGK